MNDSDSDRTEIAFGSTRDELIGYAILYLFGTFLLTVWLIVRSRPEMTGLVYDRFLIVAVELILGWPVLVALGLLMIVVGYAYRMEKQLEKYKELEERKEELEN